MYDARKNYITCNKRQYKVSLELILIMHICVLGASGRSGIHVLKQALNSNHKVTSIVRNARKLEKQIKSPNHEVIEGNVCKADDLKGPFSKADAVISTLGQSPSFRPITIYTESTEAIIEAARSSLKSKRILFCSGYGVHPEFRNDLDIFKHFVNYMTLKWVYKMVLENSHKANLMYMAAQDLNWTIVLPPYLLNKPAEVTNKRIVAEEWVHYIYMDNHSMTMMRRADLARFMLQAAEEDKHIKKIVAVAVDDKHYSEAAKLGKV